MRETKSWAGEVDFGAASIWGPARYNQERLRWFRQWLYNSSDDDLSDAERTAAAQDMEWPVNFFMMGTGDGHRTAEGRCFYGGEWRKARTWPLPNAVEHTLHLHVGSHSNSSGKDGAGAGGTTLCVLGGSSSAEYRESHQSDGMLLPSPPTASGDALQFTYDPEDPVPSLGGAVVGGLMGLVSPEEGGPQPSEYEAIRHGDQFATWRANFKVNVAAGPMHQGTPPI